jgi:hypothetical protein
VTVNAAKANTAVCRPAPINDGLMQSGSEIATTATAKLNTIRSNQGIGSPTSCASGDPVRSREVSDLS